MNQRDKTTGLKFHFPKFSLKWKLVGLVILVGSIPLVLAMVFSYIQGNKSLENVIGSSFKALALEASKNIDLIVLEEVSKIHQISRHPTILLSVQEQNRTLDSIPPLGFDTFLREQSKLWKDGDDLFNSLVKRVASRVLISFNSQDINRSEITKAVFVTDARGILVASINHHPSYENAYRPSWKSIIKSGKKIYIGDLYLNSKTQSYLLEFALPILDRNNKPIGVFHRLYSAKDFFAPFIEPIQFGKTGRIMLIDSKGLVLDCPILPTGHQLRDPNLIENTTGPTASWVKTLGNGHGGKEASIIGFSPLKEVSKITYSSTGKRWYTFAWKSSGEVFALTNKLFWWMAIAGLMSILLIATTGSLAVQKFIRPIRQLQKAAVSIGRGEQVAPLNIKTGDELETLANEINRMQILIQSAFAGLEQKVEEKSQEVLYLKEYSESILMSVPEAIIIFNQNLKIEYANSASDNLLQTATENWKGKTLLELPLKPRKAWDHLERELVKYLKANGQPSSLETQLKSTKKKIIDPLTPKAPDLKKEYSTTVTLGDRIFVYKFFDAVVKMDAGRRVGLLLKDITEEKLLLDHLTRADKLSGFGTLAAGIAHEMNNPLFKVMGFSEGIIKKATSSEIQGFAKKIFDQAKHMASVISNLTGYIQSSDIDSSKEIDINERIEAAAKIAFMATYSNDIVLEKDFGKLPSLHGKPTEIQHVFVHLLQNSVQAMKGRGTIYVTSRHIHESIEVRVKDTGPGIPLEYLSKLFDPFFTTKEPGEGIGLGLNIVHRIVEKYGGNIEVNSEPGQGSEFIITFPIEG